MRLDHICESVSNRVYRLIARLWLDEYGEEWSGKLYRVGGDGLFFHTDPAGARFYGSDVVEYDLPFFKNPLLLDTDRHFDRILELSGLDEIEDVAVAIEAALPKIVELGYDCVVINGDTGAGTTGVPVEVVDLRGYRRI